MKKQIITIAISTILLLVLSFAVYKVTFAWFESTQSANMSTTTSGKLNIDYVNGDNIVDGVLIPTTNYKNGLSSNIKFKTVNSTLNVACTLKLDITTIANELKSGLLKWAVYKNAESTPISTGNFQNANQGDTITLLSNFYATSTYNIYSVYIWLDGSTDTPSNMQNKQLEAKYYVEASQSNAS